MQDIENTLVDIGEPIIPHLINLIKNEKGKMRGTIGMILIRIGKPCISYLKEEAKDNKEFEWIANYLINEISY